jgi:hypothetical protein
MHEVFPVVAGIAVGLVALRVTSLQLRWLLVAVASVIFGVLATIISGEALMGWAFVLIDIPLVLGTAIGTMVVAPWVIERIAHERL